MEKSGGGQGCWMFNDEGRKDAWAVAERMIQLHGDQIGWNLAIEKKWSCSMFTSKWYFWDAVASLMKEKKFLEERIAEDVEAALESLKNLTNKA
jgi:hypothetical protein